MPVAGTRVIAGLTRDQAEQRITEALFPYYKDLSGVSLRVDKYTANRVTVLGTVQRPGVFYFDQYPTLLGALARAGFTMSTSNQNVVPELCTIYRGPDQVIVVQLRQLLQGASLTGDVPLRQDDIVFVPQSRQLFVSVLGEVNHPGTVILTPQSTLRTVLAEAGSFSPSAGISPKVRIVQLSKGRVVEVTLKELLSPQEDARLLLLPGDVIYVPKSGFSKVGGVLEKIGPVATLVSLAAIAAP